MKVIDLIIRIKNAAKAQRREIILPFSNLNKEVAKVLVKEGFLVEIREEKKGNIKNLKIEIAYDRRIPRLYDISIISKPSLKKYVNSKEIAKIENRGKLPAAIFALLMTFPPKTGPVFHPVEIIMPI